MYSFMISKLLCVHALSSCVFAGVMRDCSSPQIQFDFTCLHVDSGRLLQVEKTVLFI